jgi:hypothetical protein
MQSVLVFDDVAECLERLNELPLVDVASEVCADTPVV